MIIRENTATIRHLEEDEFDLLASFSHPQAQGEWKAWLEWFARYRPEHRVFMVATLDDEIVGYCIGTACCVKVGNERQNIYRAVLFVHPDCRRKRADIFALLIRKSHEEVKKRSSAIYAFPVRRIIPYLTHEKKFHYVKTVSRYFRILKMTYLLEQILKRKMALGFPLQSLVSLFFSRTKPRSDGEMAVKEIDFFDERFNELWEKASKMHPIILVRDQEYLNWRYFQEPGQKYVIFAAEIKTEILGYIILNVKTNDKRAGAIIDLFDVKDQAVTSSLLLRAIDYFRKQGVSRVEFYVSDNYYEAVLRSFGFFEKSDPKAGAVFLVKSYSPETDETTFFNPKNWFLTRADMLLA